MIKSIVFDPTNAMPAAIRIELARSGSALLRKHCFASQSIMACTDLVDVAVTKAEIRFRFEKGGQFHSIPTPAKIARMIDRHDKGGKLRRMVIDLDVSQAIPVPMRSRSHDPRPRHDFTPMGTPRPRKPRGTVKPRTRWASREGFSRPLFEMGN